MQVFTKIYALSKRNVILRYKNSIAGFFWGFLKPLIYLLIFIVIFSSQFKTVDNYILYATSGLVFWFFFSNVTSQSVQNIVSSGGLLKAIRLPAVFFPLSEMISEIFNFLLTLIVFGVVMYWFGLDYGIHLILLIPCIILFSFFTLGITLILSSVNVFLRDAGIIWNTIQPALFYMTPIAYPEGMVPEKFSFVVKYNPIYHFIGLGRSIIYAPSTLSLHEWIICSVLAFVSFVLGLFIFNTLKNQFVSAI